MLLAQGNRYVMVMENSDAGPILEIVIKLRTKEYLTKGFTTVYDTLKKVGINPILHRIDNEYSKELINKMNLKD